MIKAVIFDLDGVLFDSYEANFIYFKELGKLLKLRVPSRSEFHKKYYYQPTKEMLKILNNIKDMKKLTNKLKAAQGKITAHWQHEKLSEGSEEALKKLHKNYLLGLATSRSKTGLDRYLKFAKTKKYFKAIVGLDHVKNHKPHPESLLLAAKILKIKPTEAVYVGDAPTDLKAARGAGMKIIIFGKKKIKGADAYVKNFNQLIPAIKKLKYV